MQSSKLFLLCALVCLFSSWAWSIDTVENGIDILIEQEFRSIADKRVALLTHAPARTKKGESTYKAILKSEQVNIVKIFTPEHGLSGSKKDGQMIADSILEKSKIPVISLYGKTKRMEPEMLQNVDVLLIDLVDVGVRFYTYATTMAMALEAAAQAQVPVILLDRPNPLSGAVVEGAVLGSGISHFTAYLQVPLRHGLTMGELALWHRQQKKLNVKLDIVKVKNWQRGMFFPDTKLKFFEPSPNLRNFEAEVFYPGIGALEATNLSVGRGTKNPFHVFGAPWITPENAAALVERLEFSNVSGFSFRTTNFTPKDDLYAGEKCNGVEIQLTDIYDARPVEIFLQIMQFFLESYPDQFQVRWEEMVFVTGSKEMQTVFSQGGSVQTLVFLWNESAKKFQEKSKSIWLY